MRITFFTENYYRGGLDTFFITLVNHWPEDSDELRLVCNHNHPGLDVIRAGLNRPCEIVGHHVPIYATLAMRTRRHPLANALRKLCSPVLKYAYLAYDVVALRGLLLEKQPHRLVVLNGGYPGGDSCRAAGISWGIFSGNPRSIHNYHSMATPPLRFFRFPEFIVDSLLARFTATFVTVSRAAAESMAARPAIETKGITFIYNGVAPSPPRSGPINLRDEMEFPPESLLCLMMASFDPHKGHAFLLKAFHKVAAAIPNAYLLMCGHGTTEQMDEVRRMVAELGLDERVRLQGFRQDVSFMLQQADLLLIASQEFESFGLTAVEAMMHRVPVVTTKVGGLPEVVADGDGGFCIGRDDVDSYAAHVIDLLSDANLRKKQGERGYARYRRLFTADRMAQEYAALVKSDPPGRA